CSIVIQVSDVVALHSNSVSVPAHPVKSKALLRGINSINSFMIFLAIYQLFFQVHPEQSVCLNRPDKFIPLSRTHRFVNTLKLSDIRSGENQF
ncbi:hypothetical protein, partial [Brevundimonas sp.]|uniref:hypothetical protein n=1 Tax=Brevundimonas sp. TaxID=1871086 RepID=UPI003458EF81